MFKISILLFSLTIFFGISEAIIQLQISKDMGTWYNLNQICNGRTVGKDLFNGCQPDTCKPENIQEIVILDLKETVWINGYVERSPALTYHGCYEITKSLKGSTLEALDKILSMENTSILDCLRFCERSGEFILLRMNFCYCLPEATYKQWTKILLTFGEKSTSLCNLSCADDTGYLFCGSEDEDRIILSVYQVDHLDQVLWKIGQICFFVLAGTHKINKGSCKEKKSFKCQKMEGKRKEGAKHVCYNEYQNWYDARGKCKQNNEVLQFYSPSLNLCENNQDVHTKDTWHNKFILERILWDPDMKHENLNRSCLALHRINTSEYEFLTENCTTNYRGLCEVGKSIDSTSDMSASSVTTTFLIANTAISTESAPISSDITVKENLVPNSDETPQEENKTPVIVGSIASILLLVIALIIFAIFVNRRKKRQQTQLIPSENSVYYSTVDDSDMRTTDYDYADHVVVKQNDGVYNHLGDEAPKDEMPQPSQLYDHTGVNENEYDVSNPNSNFINKREDNVYDESREMRQEYDQANVDFPDKRSGSDSLTDDYEKILKS